MEGELKTVVTKPVTKHFDLINALEVIAPACVAIVIIVGYIMQVLETGNTDSELGSSLPVIVSAYFIIHVAQSNKRAT